ncbi:MAG: hypothetical protein HGA49_00075 [Eubacteriaceae bacterium]|nr:hypothetical protein [Eubacteriaceae bacterium]
MNVQRSKKKNKVKMPVIYIAAVVIIALTWLNLNSKKTLVLYNEKYIKTYEAKSFILRNEKVIYYDQTIEFNAAEGTRVSETKILSDSQASYDNYIQNQIAIIDNVLKSIGQPKKIVQYELLDDLDSQIKSAGQDKIETYAYKKMVTLESIKFKGIDQATLEQYKAQLNEKLNNTKVSKITLSNSGISFPGYVFFSYDGYEELLHIDNMDLVTPGYLEKVSKYGSSNYYTSKSILKVVDDDYVYIAFTVPADVVFQSEAALKEKTDKIYDSLEDDSLKSYLGYLNRRVDVLRTMPKIKFANGDQEYSGYLIKTILDKERKVIILEVKDNIDNVMLSKRMITNKVYTYENTGYLIPNKSIQVQNGKKSIVIMSKGYLKKTIPVTVTDMDGDNAFLSKSENQSISDGMQLILNP